MHRCEIMPKAVLPSSLTVSSHCSFHRQSPAAPVEAATLVDKPCHPIGNLSWRACVTSKEESNGEVQEANLPIQHGIPRRATKEDKSTEAREREAKEIQRYQELVEVVESQVSLHIWHFSRMKVEI